MQIETKAGFQREAGFFNALQEWKEPTNLGAGFAWLRENVRVALDGSGCNGVMANFVDFEGHSFEESWEAVRSLSLHRIDSVRHRPLVARQTEPDIRG